MRFFQSLIVRQNTSLIEALVGSVLCVAAATIVRAMLIPALGSTTPFVTYFPVVLLATVLWGARWGGAVLIASILVARRLFMPLSQTVSLSPIGLAAFATFILSGVLILVTGESLRQALRKLQVAHESDILHKAELLHRMKNTLTIVQSLAFFLSRKTTDSAELYRLLEMRLHALVKSNEILLADRFDACSLPDAAEAALAPFAADGRITFVGAESFLDPICAEPLLLALHELGTNAHKYGALSVPQGSVELSWAVSTSDPSKCLLRWVETNGPLVQPPARYGLGQRLLTRQRGLDEVTIAYAPSGLICALTVPLTRG